MQFPCWLFRWRKFHQHALRHVTHLTEFGICFIHVQIFLICYKSIAYRKAIQYFL
jgi:hypothetical protein